MSGRLATQVAFTTLAADGFAGARQLFSNVLYKTATVHTYNPAWAQYTKPPCFPKKKALRVMRGL